MDSAMGENDVLIGGYKLFIRLIVNYFPMTVFLSTNMMNYT